MDKVYDVKNLKVTTKSISFSLSDASIVVPLNATGSTILAQAKPDQLQIYKLDPNGIGIYWPGLDEDLSIEGLLQSSGHHDLIKKHKLPKWYREELPVNTN